MNTWLSISTNTWLSISTNTWQIISINIWLSISSNTWISINLDMDCSQLLIPLGLLKNMTKTIMHNKYKNLVTAHFYKLWKSFTLCLSVFKSEFLFCGSFSVYLIFFAKTLCLLLKVDFLLSVSFSVYLSICLALSLSLYLSTWLSFYI